MMIYLHLHLNNYKEAITIAIPKSLDIKASHPTGASAE
jgi:hypothetical protein